MTSPTPQPELREAVARIILGPKSHWNMPGQDRRLAEWMFYPEVERALTKADSILAMIAASPSMVETQPLAEPCDLG